MGTNYINIDEKSNETLNSLSTYVLSFVCESNSDFDVRCY